MSNSVDLLFASLIRKENSRELRRRSTEIDQQRRVLASVALQNNREAKHRRASATYLKPGAARPKSAGLLGRRAQRARAASAGRSRPAAARGTAGSAGGGVRRRPRSAAAGRTRSHQASNQQTSYPQGLQGPPHGQGQGTRGPPPQGQRQQNKHRKRPLPVSSSSSSSSSSYSSSRRPVSAPRVLQTAHPAHHTDHYAYAASTSTSTSTSTSASTSAATAASAASAAFLEAVDRRIDAMPTGDEKAAAITQFLDLASTDDYKRWFEARKPWQRGYQKVTKGYNPSGNDDIDDDDDDNDEAAQSRQRSYPADVNGAGGSGTLERRVDVRTGRIFRPLSAPVARSTPTTRLKSRMMNTAAHTPRQQYGGGGGGGGGGQDRSSGGGNASSFLKRRGHSAKARVGPSSAGGEKLDARIKAGFWGDGRCVSLHTVLYLTHSHAFSL